MADAQLCPKAILPCTCSKAEDNTSTMNLNCHQQKLNDTEIDHILNLFLNATDNKALPPLIKRLSLSGNHLTQIPKQIKHFPVLRDVTLADNELTSVSLNDFNFDHPNQLTLERLVLSNNQISHIDGVLRGIITNFNG